MNSGTAASPTVSGYAMTTMRTLITISFFFLSLLVFGQTKEKLTGKPTTLEETYKYLNQMFDDTAKYGFMTLPEDVATGRLHHGFGMWIRNNWGLWGDSKLKHYFLDKGVGHPDDMSGIILTSYHRHLNNKPIDLDGQIKKYKSFYDSMVKKGDTISFSQDFFKDRTTDSTLLSYFPLGDTILVSIYASYKKLFSTYASSVRAIAIVKEHRKDKLLVEIINMVNSPKKKPERKIGDIYEESPQDCSLLPPKKWGQNRE